jgi:ABC-type transport system involved in multi-copper enzyme maturation permease subunit
MYLWKYWRESRYTFACGMVLVGLLLWAVLRIHLGALSQWAEEGRSQNLSQLYLFIAAPLMIPLGFLGLLFGSFGVGRDLGEGSGSFLFSRPRSRAFFVWNDWGFGVAQLLAVVIAANAVLVLAIHRLTPDSGPIFLGRHPVSMFTVFSLHCTAGLLLIGLMFGLTYFTSVLAKSRGVLLSLGVLVVYLISKTVVKHYWPDVTLPDLSLTEFTMSRSPTMPAGFPNHLGLDIALRTAVALAFPVGAQLLLQQREID